MCARRSVNSDGTVLVAGEGAFAEDGVTIADPSKIESRPVTLGRGNQDYVEITSGLEEGRPSSCHPVHRRYAL